MNVEVWCEIDAAFSEERRLERDLREEFAQMPMSEWGEQS